jgi:hypothetical protein
MCWTNGWMRGNSPSLARCIACGQPPEDNTAIHGWHATAHWQVASNPPIAAR